MARNQRRVLGGQEMGKRNLRLHNVRHVPGKAGHCVCVVFAVGIIWSTSQFCRVGAGLSTVVEETNAD